MRISDWSSDVCSSDLFKDSPDMRREGAPDLDAVTCVVRLDQHDLHRVEDGARPGSGRHAGKIERTGRCEHQGCGRPSDLDAGFAMADIDQAARDLRV